ncbi:MAG TPA: YceI family protein, partial [Pyrinomonadaceae bacterium]|nr:YceI family protein [Pyrinomonadaceae bacterium]
MLLKTLFAGLLFISLAGAQTSTTAPYPIDANHSTIGFNVPILNGLSKVSGKFTEFTITLNQDQSDITRSSVNVVIKAASI